MGKNSEELNDYVKKQTLIGAVVFALIIGFVGGTVYSSFKLAASTSTPSQQQAQVNQKAGQPQDQEGEAAAYAAKILQLEQYLKTNPTDAEAWTQLGNHLFDTNQYSNAINAYKKSLELAPGKIGVITDLGVMYRRNKQPQKAIEAFDKAISIDPSFETARFNKGIVLLHDLNDVPGGIKAWEELVKMNPMAMAPNGESVDSLIQRMKKIK